MYQWGDPYAEDGSWRDVKVGDQVRVRVSISFYTNQVGTLVAITEEDTYMVRFSDGQECGFDGDMLSPVRREG